MRVPYLPPGGALPLQAGQRAAGQAAGWLVGKSLAVKRPEWAFDLRVHALHVPKTHRLAAARRALRSDKEIERSTMRLIGFGTNSFC